jgi:hypothetical protein
MYNLFDDILENTMNDNEVVFVGQDLIRPLFKSMGLSDEKFLELVFTDFEQHKVRYYFTEMEVGGLLALHENLAKRKNIQDISFTKPSEWLLEYGHRHPQARVSVWVERLEFIEQIIAHFAYEFNAYKNDLKRNLDATFKSDPKRIATWAFLNPLFTPERDQEKLMVSFLKGGVELVRVHEEIHQKFIEVGVNKIGDPEKLPVNLFYQYFSPNFRTKLLEDAVFGR